MSSEYQKLVEAVARAIAAEIGRQDYGEPFPLDGSLCLAYLDQGEVDFGKVARAALSALKIPHAGDAMSEQNVQVTQVDRDAAADLHVALSSGMVTNAAQCAEAIRNGLNDHWEIVAAFARHRTCAEPDLVEVLREALKLAANRLDRCAVEALGTGKVNQYEWHEWADEARAALTRADV